MNLNPIVIGMYKEIGGDDYKPLRELISDKPINKKGVVIWYLKNAPVMMVSLGRMKDEITGELIPRSKVVHSDGMYYWHSETVYHFEKYNLTLQQDFIDHAIKRQLLPEEEVRNRWREYESNLIKKQNDDD